MNRIIIKSSMSKSYNSVDPVRLDSELLRTFLAVTREGSFSRAAECVFRSQSAISLQIKQLEAVLGRPLFQRHARGVMLNQCGEKLLPVAEQVIALLDRTAGELRADPLHGSIRIGIPDEYGSSLLPGVIAQFLREHPRVELSVRCSFSADFPAALERGEIDLALHAVETPRDGMRVIHHEATCWASSGLHAPQTRDPLPIAIFDRACWWRERALQALERNGREYRVVFSSESVTGVAAAVAAGVAVGVLGESSLRDGLIRLSPAEGFPALPDSVLVLEAAADVDPELAAAIGDALSVAFDRESATQARVAVTQ
jgi:DNA-binding transcriptional LysR family regulator